MSLNITKNINDVVSTIGYATITFMIILIAILYYVYYSKLRARSCKWMDNLYGTLNGQLSTMRDTSQPLFNYYIKSAYNCCSPNTYRNDYVDLCSLKDILKQGVRGLDFEIFSINDRPVVATSTEKNYHLKETFNSIDMADVMEIIKNYAFSGSTAPNYGDPIIMHFRIKSTNKKMYKNFAKVLGGYNTRLLDKEYSFENHGKNLGETPLSKLMGKIIIIVDRTNNTFLDCPEFHEYVNMCSNSLFMRSMHYYDIQYNPDMTELIDFNRQDMTIGMPDKGENPSNPSAVVLRECGVQMIAMRYSYIDVNIEESDAFFNSAGNAFVLKPENLRFIQQTIKTPPNQNPALSFGTRTISSDFYKFDI